MYTKRDGLISANLDISLIQLNSRTSRIASALLHLRTSDDTRTRLTSGGHCVEVYPRALRCIDSSSNIPDAPGEETSDVSATVTATSGPASGASTSTRSDITSTSDITTTSALSTESSSTSAIQSTIIEGSQSTITRASSDPTEVFASTSASISESTFASTRVVDPSSPSSAPASPTTAPSSTTEPSASLVAFAKTEDSSSASESCVQSFLFEMGLPTNIGTSTSTSEDISSTAPPPEMPSDTASEPSSSSTDSVTSTESEEPTSTSTEAPTTTSESTSDAAEPTSADSEPTSDSTSSSQPTSTSDEATNTTTEAKTTSSGSEPSSSETIAGKEQATSTSSSTNESSSTNDAGSTTFPATSPTTSASDSDSEASETGTAGKAEKTVTSMVDTTVSGHSSSATATRTITDAPDSTLSQVLSLTSTFTNAQGRLITTVDAPSVITITSTSTGEGGGFVYSTHVVANPTGFGGSGAISEKGFFHNTGAVAGTFTVVGLVAAAAAFLLFWLCRKRRRVQRRRRWMATVDQPPYTPNDRLPYDTSNPNSPFEDPQPQTEDVLPPLTPLTASRAASVRLGEESLSRFTDEHGRLNPSPLLPGPPPFVRPPYVNPGERMTDLERSEGSPFEDPPVTQMVSVPRMVSVQPLNVTPRYATFPQAESENNSLAPSSPSIYPDSLPPEDEHHDSSQGHSQGYQGQGYGNPFDDQPKTYIVQAPPRPARSHLRRESSKIMSTSLPLTPPDSMNGHSPSASPDHSQQPRIHINDKSPPF
ncbi:hypothetical protein EV715DRAFT_271727 [Schizophyllum commune]